ncbi:YceK/YidQ family lipoprotein [Pseudomonas hygromyciniae]|uniref:YceK/YidQ family lipoprotein n=1 Tax=Pseudomonas hygromyciniae TaxID=2812000 RepID=A0ABX7K0Q8_9PSED|nr:YceK/YidQ family lipoprotein [Pseudomonas hygromyciniae]QSB40237.1 YceK/YidQ family lipoprotein [Pseudomonas hygromyciniae]
MSRTSKVLLLACLLVAGGCSTVNTVFRPDAVASQNLKALRSNCENVPRIYSGVISGFCSLNGEPNGSRSMNDQAINDIPSVAVDFMASGVLDTLMLPYTVYRQHRDGSIEIFR